MKIICMQYAVGELHVAELMLHIFTSYFEGTHFMMVHHLPQGYIQFMYIYSISYLECYMICIFETYSTVCTCTDNLEQL